MRTSRGRVIDLISPSHSPDCRRQAVLSNSAPAVPITKSLTLEKAILGNVSERVADDEIRGYRSCIATSQPCILDSNRYPGTHFVKTTGFLSWPELSWSPKSQSSTKGSVATKRHSFPIAMRLLKPILLVVKATKRATFSPVIHRYSQFQTPGHERAINRSRSPSYKKAIKRIQIPRSKVSS